MKSGRGAVGEGVHPIEAESTRILRDRYDLSRFGPLSAAVVERIVHATADPGFIETLVIDDEAVAAGVTALRAGAVVVADVEMVRVGVAGGRARCYLGGAQPYDPRDQSGPTHEATVARTRSAGGIAEAARLHPDGAVVAVGCAPTALMATVDLVERGEWRPALVVGVPVGFVGAAESKERARTLTTKGVAVISNVGERGGSAVAVAAVNAIMRLAGRADGAT